MGHTRNTTLEYGRAYTQDAGKADQKLFQHDFTDLRVFKTDHGQDDRGRVQNRLKETAEDFDTSMWFQLAAIGNRPSTHSTIHRCFSNDISENVPFACNGYYA